MALAIFAFGCTTRHISAERFPVSDLLRDPDGFVGAREIPPGTREKQMQDIAYTLRECVGQEVWTGDGASLVVDGESLVVHADSATVDEIRRVLTEIRRFFPNQGGR